MDVRAPLDLGFLTALDWMLWFMPTLPEDVEILGFPKAFLRGSADAPVLTLAISSETIPLTEV